MSKVLINWMSLFWSGKISFCHSQVLFLNTPENLRNCIHQGVALLTAEAVNRLLHSGTLTRCLRCRSKTRKWLGLEMAGEPEMLQI